MPKVMIPTKVEPATRDALDKLAADERRTRSSLIEILLDEALAARKVTPAKR